MFERDKPYNELPPLPPNQDLETKKTLKAAIAANKALAQLKTRGNLLPNQSMLIDSLVLLEAKDSSEIEDIFTTNDKLYQADAIGGKAFDPHTKEVRRYREALWHVVNSVHNKPLGVNTFIDIYRIIKENQSGVLKTSGTKIASPFGDVVYTPPDGYERLLKLLGNLEQFMHNQDDIDPLIKMAVLHYQFEAIHPFSDGNGRTGRILNILYLLQEHLLDVPILFLSSYIIRNKVAYYKGLQNVTEQQAWEEWIIYMLKAVEVTSYETIARIDAIRLAMKSYKAKMQKELPSNVYGKELLEIIFEQPYCTTQSLVDRGIAQRQTAAIYLKQISDIELLIPQKIGRYKVYINPTLMDILNKSPEALL